MADPDSNPTARRRHPVLRALLRFPLLVAATIYFLIDDVVLAAVRPVVAWFAELKLFARLGEAIHRLPPYPTLVLFLVPFIVLEPFKLWALWLLGTGRFGSGAAMLTTSHLVSIVLVERLFHATRDKLLTIGWFARIHGLVTALYDWSLGRLRATAVWRAMAAAMAGMRAVMRGLLAPVRIVAGRIVAAVRGTIAAMRMR